MANKSPQQLRQEAVRAQKLESIREQIAGGTLKVRQMTPADFKKHGKPAVAPRASRRSDAAHQRGRG